MLMERAWSMPSKNTFSIKPINKFVKDAITELDKLADDPSKLILVDPFANNSCFNSIMTFTNDLDPKMPTTHHLDALEFLQTLQDESVDFLLFDPPYSVRQVSECYRSLGKTVNMETTQSTFWTNIKKEIARVMKSDGVVLSFGWNSGGIGKSLGFKIEHILLVAHGGVHNDTICVKEKKL